jgi:hypothetical protein
MGGILRMPNNPKEQIVGRNRRVIEITQEIRRRHGKIRSAATKERWEHSTQVGTSKASDIAPLPPADDIRYSWLTDHLERLEGKQAREDYYALLKSETR